MEKLIPIGILVVFIGVFMIIAGSLYSSSSSGTGKTNVAVGGFIGPIPFGWATDKRMMWVVIGIMVAMAVFWMIFNSSRWLR